MSNRRLAIDLFCGLGGWAQGLMAAGWDVVGFDIERHVYGEHHYPAQLVLQDVLTLHGSQFRRASLIVASPPCQEYSYMAMPWTRGKQIAAALQGTRMKFGRPDFPEPYTGSRTVEQLTALFDACFRLQREASEAAGRHIPMVVENVKGAQPWVGAARASFGSYYLWGDIDTVGTRIVCGGSTLYAPQRSGGKRRDRNFHSGADWWWEPLQERRKRATAIKNGGDCTRDDSRLTPAYKGLDGKSWIRNKECDPRPSHGNSVARRAASALIAKIPFELARFVGQAFLRTEMWKEMGGKP